MIKRFFTFLTFCVVLSSCKKDNDNACTLTASTFVVPPSEMATLQTYIAGNHPTATLSSGGFYYEINTVGTGTATADVCSSVSVKYAGYLTNGTKFTTAAEETTGATYTLGQLILGWQRGIPLAKAGGTITLYLPPSLAYGSNAVGTIPANSILIFVIQLVSIN